MSSGDTVKIFFKFLLPHLKSKRNIATKVNRVPTKTEALVYKPPHIFKGGRPIL